jgi:hypothetical protein
MGPESSRLRRSIALLGDLFRSAEFVVDQEFAWNGKFVRRCPRCGGIHPDDFKRLNDAHASDGHVSGHRLGCRCWRPAAGNTRIDAV